MIAAVRPVGSRHRARISTEIPVLSAVGPCSPWPVQLREVGDKAKALKRSAVPAGQNLACPRRLPLVTEGARWLEQACEGRRGELQKPPPSRSSSRRAKGGQRRCTEQESCSRFLPSLSFFSSSSALSRPHWTGGCCHR